MQRDTRLRPGVGDQNWSWIGDSVLPFSAYSVGSLVPTLFQAYGRVLHPAQGPAGLPIRWDEVAAWSGRTMHGLAQFAAIANPLDVQAGPAPFIARPEDGALPRPSLAALVGTLAVYTATPESCFVGVWEGRGWLHSELVETARLELPERAHLIFEGLLVAVLDLGWLAPGGPFMHEAPSVMWPADRAWFVSTDVDLDSTYVGGSTALVNALRSDRRLEVWPASPSDSITVGSDEINVG